jgi:aldehyde:ferredoxin oxidoreductase
MHGYHGRILRVDLTSGKIWDELLPETLARQYLGGSGLAAWFLYHETDAATDPRGPDNLLCFLVGPFTGTPVPTSNRFAVAARSPLTGIWGESDCGGRWGAALKESGFDGILISGQAPSPVCLWVEDGQAELRDASDMWGMDTYELDLGAEMVCIGPAAERGVRFAAIMSGREDGRAAGRTGLGTVMGVKRLKAIACRGRQRAGLADRTGLLASVRPMSRNLRGTTVPPLQGASTPAPSTASVGLHEYGTAGAVPALERFGDMPIRNWTVGEWEDGAQRISGQQMAETILTGTYACGGCPIGCGRVVEIKGGRFAGVKGAGPEYETLAAMGSLCLVDDLEAIAKLNEMCNRYGMDTITTGSVIAFVMEAKERGLLEEGPDWGDADGAIALVERIVRQEDDLARLLGQGVRAAAEKLGGQAREFAIHSKGLELPMHDPRGFFSAALGYATSNRGGCHLQAMSHVFERSVTMPEIGVHQPLDRHATERKGELVARAQDLMCLFDSLKVCKFAMLGGVRLSHLTDWLRAITGWDVDNEEMLAIGERIYNLKRMFNVRLGVSRKDDSVPTRLLVHRLAEGGTAGKLPPLGEMLADYYAARGWTPEGIPATEKLQGLGLRHSVRCPDPEGV